MGNGSDNTSPNAIKAFFARLIVGKGNEDATNWRFWLLFSTIAAILALVLYALAGGHWPLIQNIAAGALVAAAAAAVGIMLGFLFGIPRSLQREEVATDPGQPFQSVRANTNLEQISDWLTKIIIGVGLVQAGKIIAIVQDVAAKAGHLFVVPRTPAAVPRAPAPIWGAPVAASETSGLTPEVGAAYVLVLMILFSIIGFLVGYLWARIYLQETFNDMARRAERQPEYFEGLMNSYLYMSAPKGFQEALSVLEAYKKRIGDSLTDRMWTYWTMALGQQYAYKIEKQKKPRAELTGDRDEFVEKLKTALRQDSEARSLLRLELDPDGRVPKELFEGDLRQFRDDPEVTKLLRKSPAALPEHFEGLMHSYLYVPAPEGFREALSIRDKYKKRFGDSLTDRMWTYSVVALGQQYAYGIEQEKKTRDDLAGDRIELLMALKIALRQDPEAGPFLRAELEPDGKMPEKLFDGALRQLKDDPELVDLLREKTTAL